VQRRRTDAHADADADADADTNNIYGVCGGFRSRLRTRQPKVRLYADG
jgi:hypothetical protein